MLFISDQSFTEYHVLIRSWKVTFWLQISSYRKPHLLKTVHYVPGSLLWVTDQCTAVTLMAMIAADIPVLYVYCTAHKQLYIIFQSAFPPDWVYSIPQMLCVIVDVTFFTNEPTALIGTFHSKCTVSRTLSCKFIFSTSLWNFQCKVRGDIDLLATKFLVARDMYRYTRVWSYWGLTLTFLTSGLMAISKLVVLTIAKELFLSAIFVSFS